MLGDSRCQEADERGRSRAALATCLSARVCRKISAATLARVHGQVRPGVAGASWCEDFIYRAIAHHRENDTIESFNGKLRDELLEWEAFDTLLEAKVLFRSVAAEHQHDPTTQCLGIQGSNMPWNHRGGMGVALKALHSMRGKPRWVPT